MSADSPIVDEVRRRRAAVLAHFNYDLRKYGENLMARQGKRAKRGTPRATRKRSRHRVVRAADYNTPAKT